MSGYLSPFLLLICLVPARQSVQLAFPANVFDQMEQESVPDIQFKPPPPPDLPWPDVEAVSEYCWTELSQVDKNNNLEPHKVYLLDKVDWTIWFRQVQGRPTLVSMDVCSEEYCWSDSQMVPLCDINSWNAITMQITYTPELEVHQWYEFSNGQTAAKNKSVFDSLFVPVHLMLWGQHTVLWTSCHELVKTDEAEEKLQECQRELQDKESQSTSSSLGDEAEAKLQECQHQLQDREFQSTNSSLGDEAEAELQECQRELQDKELQIIQTLEASNAEISAICRLCTSDATEDWCTLDPCFPGVLCSPLTEEPYYTCGECPPNYFANGSTCVFKGQCDVGYAGDGTVCGPDSDLDGYPNEDLACDEPKCRRDNCINRPNSGQEDADGDGIGDVCDSDADGDSIFGKKDNCPLVANPDQLDSDGDEIGDACDGCPFISTSIQQDTDGDGIGDECDEDMDNDNISNELDNCPKHYNPDQKDTDLEGVGDACDNCLNITNPGQEDADNDFVGDACDDDADRDGDGIQDDLDNCPSIANNNQLDTDDDGQGDLCDDDMDNDGLSNENDNCPLIPNPHQRFICKNDNDGDSSPNEYDNCPDNSEVQATDFRNYTTVSLDPKGSSQVDPVWVIKNDGAEIHQLANSDPGLAVGSQGFDGVNYEGTLYIGNNYDNDYVGVVFGYQDSAHFYVVMWKQSEQKYWEHKPFEANALPGIQVKLVASSTGPGTYMRNALWHSGDTPDQVKLLWIDPENIGWKARTSYRWKILHRPNIGLIRLQLFEGGRLHTDSGNLYDSNLKGGRLGVFEFSQRDITWSYLTSRCTNDVPQAVYDELPPNLKGQVKVDATSIIF